MTPPNCPNARLDEIVTALQPQEWDMLLFGDGSGAVGDQPCGWGCVAIVKQELRRTLFYGACSHGSNNYAELMAYLSPLTWYQRNYVNIRVPRLHHIHICTDSSYVQARLSNSQPASLTNNALWLALKTFEHAGLRLHWHWIPRDSLRLNTLADAISRDARLGLSADLSDSGYLLAKHQMTAESCNPD